MERGIDLIDVAIAVGKRRGTLRLVAFGPPSDTTAWGVSDDHGVIFIE